MEMKQQESRPAYIGRILQGRYSDRLKERLERCLCACRMGNELFPRVFSYIAVWKDDGKKIWYEYVDDSLADLFCCRPDEVANHFPKRIIDRRSYRDRTPETALREMVLSRRDLAGRRGCLRQETKARGVVEAVYKLSLPDQSILWLKDWARTEYYSEDGINLSMGSLTDVSSEMDHKEALEQIGYYDELTGLPKRSTMERILEINLGQMRRGHLADFVFMMMDLDHFKQVNDTYGHQAGDYILARLGEELCVMKRKEDEIGRYAGEEFYVIAHGGRNSARCFAERVRRRIEAAAFCFNEVDIAVTISVGLAAASELAKGELSGDTLIALADRRLYAAKARGRNCIVWDDEENR